MSYWLMALFTLPITALLFYYQAQYYQGQVADKEQMLIVLNKEFTAARENIRTMAGHQAIIAATDKKHTEELAHAKNEIDSLRIALTTSNQRLHLNASCVSKTAGPARVDDVGWPRLTDAAQQNYLNLRTRIATVDRQIAGLRGYINHVCLATSYTTTNKP